MFTPFLVGPLRLCAQIVVTTLLLTVTTMALRADTPGGELERYRDKNRLLLFFAPSATDPRYARQSERFTDSANPKTKGKISEGLKERDLLRFDLFERGTSRGGGMDLSVVQTNALRQQFGVRKGQFKVILIGKDGHTAYSAESPISASQLFSLIDAMPMRKDEMRRQQNAPNRTDASKKTATPSRVSTDGALRPDKRYAPEQVVKIQMEALQHNDVPKQDAGIAVVFAFASPENQSVTGPLEHFIQIVRAPAYLPMLNCKSISYDTIVLGQNGDTARQRVRIVTKDGTQISYLFLLSRQTAGPYAGCWMNDGCIRDEPPPPSVKDDV